MGGDDVLALESYTTKGITVDLTFTESGNPGEDDNFSLEHSTRGGISDIGFIQFDLDPTDVTDQNHFTRLDVDFSEPVRNLSFVLADIDADSEYADSVQVAGFDINGNIVQGFIANYGESVAINYSSDTLAAVGIDGSGNSSTDGNVEIIFPDTVSKLVIWHRTGSSGDSDPEDHNAYLSALTFENDYLAAADDYLSMHEGDTTVLRVYENDHVTCHSPYTLSVLTNFTNGSSNLMNNDSIEYIPNDKFFGIDSLQYKICDNNGLCDSAWTYVSVLSNNNDTLEWALHNVDEGAVNDSMLVYRNVVHFTTNDPGGIGNGSNFTIESNSVQGLYSPIGYLEFDLNASSVTDPNQFVEFTMDFDNEVQGLHFNLLDLDDDDQAIDSVIINAFDENNQPVDVFFYDMGEAAVSFGNAKERIFYGIDYSSSSDDFGNVGIHIPGNVAKVVIKSDPPYTSDGDGNPSDHVMYIANLAWRKPLPMIEVMNETTLIANHDNTPSIADSTDFGILLLGDSLVVDYTIYNTGTDTLRLTSPVSFTGATEFEVIAAPADTILPGDSTDIRVQFEPVTAGVKTATVSFTTNDSCNADFNFDITANATCPNFVAQVAVDNNVSCNGLADGSLTASSTGGTEPYTYTWSNSTSSATIATTASLTGVPAGTYSVTISDAFGCTSTNSGTVTEPAQLMVSSAVDSNVTCNGFATGGATASTTGGTTPYNYIWSNGATTASITGVVAGTYTVTTTDNNGCTSTSSATITEPAQLMAASVVDSNVTCNGLSNGGATASATGGTNPYNYSWSTSTSSATNATTASITGVIAGAYTVTITDNNGCTSTSSVTITEPTTLVAASVLDSNVTCNGFSNGGATASATGGTSPYSYLWSNSAITASITGVAAGVYTVTISDNNGCTSISSVTITEPTPLVISTSIDSNATCSGFANGGITATATGGVSSYTYAWSNGATTASITGITAGTYTVTLTDANGCTSTSSETILEIDTINPTVVSQDIIVYLDATGQATIAASDIDNGSSDVCGIQSLNVSQSTFDCNTIGANIVTLYVTDVNSNVDSITATVTVMDTLNPIVATQNITVYLDVNGQASITTSDIDNGSSDNCSVQSIALDSTSFDCGEIGANTVTLYVTDVNNNIDSATATVSVMDTLAPIVATQDITVYLDATGQATITTTDIDNGSTDNCSIQSITLDSTSFDCGEVGANTVMLYVTDVNNNIDSASATVTVLDTLNPIVTAQNITVYLDAAGQATITANDVDNGTSDNCSIQTLSISSTNFDCSHVGTNTVTLYATDVNNNIDSTTATVNVMDTLSPIVLTQNITVYLDGNGEANITTTDIDNGSTDNCFIQSITLDSTSFDCGEVGANTVTLYITDVNNNIDSATATVVVMDTIFPTLVVANDTALCATDANGTEVTYSLSSSDNCTTGGIVQTAGLASGSVFPIGTTTNVFEITDASGNTTIDSFQVEIYNFPTLAIDSVGVQCETNGSINLNAVPTGGVFSGNGVTGSSFDPTAVTTGSNKITYTYTTANNCTYSTDRFIQVRANPTVYLGSFADSICLEQDVVACPVGTPAGGTYSGAGIDSIVLITADAGIGQHQISYTYTDNYGCTSSDSSMANIVQCYEGVSVRELSSSQFDFILYPNPNLGRFTIQHNSNQSIECTVFSSDGALVKSIEINAKQHEISIEDQAQGIYLIRLIGDGIYEHKQIVVH